MDSFHSLALDICRPVRLTRTYAAWLLTGGEQRRITLAALTLDQAVAEMTPSPVRASEAKGGWASFAILENNDTAGEGQARQTLHIFAVKARREHRRFGLNPVAVAAAVPYAVPIGSLDVEAFEPRRPFDAFLDCPVNGRQPSDSRLIEVRS
ncbi:hypothetical protein GGQ97_002336 [Sphingomonas kaistensis]|uniref:Uncharacterized protein n=1 Tax=Sphingomonas kaistensis TaxID=298708 RepID=A0A7X5Y836_9SPHN|nr:hypothetical protein [Sphingomonas kaistensis]NJC06543.1 hypothetical protein [Sphingomonas kaistensis]